MKFNKKNSWKKRYQGLRKKHLALLKEKARWLDSVSQPNPKSEFNDFIYLFDHIIKVNEIVRISFIKGKTIGKEESPNVIEIVLCHNDNQKEVIPIGLDEPIEDELFETIKNDLQKDMATIIYQIDDLNQHIKAKKVVFEENNFIDEHGNKVKRRGKMILRD